MKNPMKRIGKLCITAAVVLSVMTQTAFADILRLKDGTEIQGTFVRYNYIFGQVIFRTTKGQVLTLSISPEVTIIKDLTTDAGDPIIDVERTYRIRNIAVFTMFGLAVVGSMMYVSTGSKRDEGKEQGPINPED